MSNIIGRLGQHPENRKRLAILDADMRPLVTFGPGENREHVAVIIAASCYKLHDDGTITERDPHHA